MRLSWISIPILLNEALHFTAKMGGSTYFGLYFGYALTVLPGGILADKIGYRRTILFSLIDCEPAAILGSLMSNHYGPCHGLGFALIIRVMSESPKHKLLA